LLLTLHHIICDGCSLGVLSEELGKTYSADGNAGDGLPELHMSYSHFVHEQEASLSGSQRAEAEAFWVGQYAVPVPPLELPTDRPRPKKRRFAGGSRKIVLGGSLTQGLKRISAQRRCSLVTTLLGAYSLLLHRLSGQAEVVIGLPMSSRCGATSDHLVGHCVNFLPLRVKVDANSSFHEHLDQVWSLLMDAHQHQNYTLGSLLQKLNRPRELNRMPLASVMFNLDWVQEPLQLDGLQTEVKSNPHCYARFDLSFSMAERNGGLELHSHYSAELFDAETIERWLRHYETLLWAIVTHPEAPLREYPALTTADGKIEMASDREPAPAQAQRISAEESSPETKAPRGPVEQKLAGIWREVVGLAEVGRNDSFFEVGGHSLLATQVISRIAKSFDVDLPLRAIFEAPTISALAEAIASAQAEQPNGASTITRRARDGKAEQILARLDQLSEAELRDLLETPPTP
jgi:acyl carrier protein